MRVDYRLRHRRVCSKFFQLPSRIHKSHIYSNRSNARSRQEIIQGLRGARQYSHRPRRFTPTINGRGRGRHVRHPRRKKEIPRAPTNGGTYVHVR